MSSEHVDKNSLSWYRDGTRSQLFSACFTASKFSVKVLRECVKCGDCRYCAQLSFTIFVDIEATMKSSGNNKFPSSVVLKCRDVLNSLSKKCQVCLIQVASYFIRQMSLLVSLEYVVVWARGKYSRFSVQHYSFVNHMETKNLKEWLRFVAKIVHNHVSKML